MAEPDRPIFIVGCPRSGTTLFRTMLHAHPRIAVPPETRFVMPGYRRRYAFGDLTVPDNRNKLATWIVDRPETRFRVLGLDADEVRQAIIDGPPTLGSAMGIVFRAYSHSHDKPRWGDKRPAYYSFIEELDALFPDAQFIHVVRDGRACVASLKRTPWLGHEPIPCMATWMTAIDCSRESGAKLGHDRFLEVRYEDLVTGPEKEMRRVSDFLGEEFVPAMCEPEKIAERVNPAHYEQRQQISEGIYTKSMESWREQLEPWEIATFEKAAGQRLALYGYDPSGVGAEPPADKVRQLIRQHKQLRTNLVSRRRTDRRHRDDADQSVAALLTEGQRLLGEGPRKRPLASHLRRSLRPAVRRVRPVLRKAQGVVGRRSTDAASLQTAQAVEDMEES
jgi:hypothetical protein